MRTDLKRRWGGDGGDGGGGSNDDDGILKPSSPIRNNATPFALCCIVLGCFLHVLVEQWLEFCDARAQLHQVANTCERDSDSAGAFGRLRLLAYPPVNSEPWHVGNQPTRMQRRMLVLSVHCLFHSIVHTARASAMQPQKRQRLETGLSLAQAIRSFGSPEPPEPRTKEEEQEEEEEVVKEEPEPEEEIDAQEDLAEPKGESLEEELAWKEEEDEEKEEEEEEGIYSQSTAAGTSTSSSQGLSQASWQPLSQDSEATEHGLEVADAAGMQEPRGGFADLDPKEKEILLTVSEHLTKEIGMKSFYTFDIRTCREDVKKLVHTFFSRYRQTESEDHYFHTETFYQNNQMRFVSTLMTPSFYRRSFRGHPMLLRSMAETSACRKFLEDTDAREVSRWLPPPSRVLRKDILAKFNKDWKEAMLQRGISPKLVQQEAIQELSDKLRSLGCRLALWDGNA